MGFSGFYEEIQWQNTTYYEKKYYVIADTTYSNGENYFVLNQSLLWGNEFVRADSNFIYFYDKVAQIDVPIFDLNLTLNTQWNVMFEQIPYTFEYYGTQYLQFSNEQTETKVFYIEIGGVEGITFYFSKKFGLLKMEKGIYLDYYRLEQISGCVISDTTYGILLPILEQTVSPQKFRLGQNYPNPFNPETTISYELPFTTEIELALYNTLGQRIKLLYSGKQSKGIHSVKLNGSGLSAGTYFYRLKSKNLVHTKKLTIIK